jgi:hypothetical protein
MFVSKNASAEKERSIFSCMCKRAFARDVHSFVYLKWQSDKNSFFTVTKNNILKQKVFLCFCWDRNLIHLCMYNSLCSKCRFICVPKMTFSKTICFEKKKWQKQYFLNI